MAVVAPGAGALSLSKPITNNDLMESLQLPGIINQQATWVSMYATATTWSAIGDPVGAFGYTQVVDDIILQIKTDWTLHSAGDFAYIEFGVASLEAGASSDLTVNGLIEDVDYFTSGATTSFKIDLAAPTSANAEGALYSVLRGTPAGTVWASTADEVAKRTFGPGRPAYLADGVTANTMTGVGAAPVLWTKPVQIIYKVTVNGTVADGVAMVAVKTHYTDVDFGPGL